MFEKSEIMNNLGIRFYRYYKLYIYEILLLVIIIYLYLGK